ncbi:hypothetical protein HFN76_28140 [Rhizobium laguerreae]|uniref:hypothetical protein n=1 Tax=Rhizobium laguerreae TaxID=1076926 RepID=UPI001C90341A|nr:hypothetical protein [Rhizobium laguerreae]MBY3516053.1 hypothetical protein [Rhizobium laguerreae]
MSSRIDWPESLGFMLLELERTKLTNITETEMSDGSFKTRHNHTPKAAWRGEARFTQLEEEVMISIVGAPAIADIPGETERRRVILMGHSAFYPGYAPAKLQITTSNYGPNFSIIRYFILDEGPIAKG